jgi:hypothetical protein
MMTACSKETACPTALRALIVQRDNDPANSATVFNVGRRNGAKFEAPIQIDLTDRT